MKANLILNKGDEIALFYGDPLGFTPEWAAIDVECGEIFISNGDNDTDEGKQITLDNIKTEIYERILPDTHILLVEVKENDIAQPVKAEFVPLMISTQI